LHERKEFLVTYVTFSKSSTSDKQLPVAAVLVPFFLFLVFFSSWGTAGDGHQWCPGQ
jgi:hypothetical protein